MSNLLFFGAVKETFIGKTLNTITFNKNMNVQFMSTLRRILNESYRNNIIYYI